MRFAMLQIMTTLSHGVCALEAVADDLVGAANELEGKPIANVMREMAKRHRVEALRLQGELAAISAQYDERFGATWKARP